MTDSPTPHRPVVRGLLLALPVLAAALVVPAATPASAATPSRVTETTVASGLGRVTAMTIAPDGRTFVLDQGGAVRVVKGGAVLATPFLRLPDVDSAGERGLLGIALDPRFATNGYVYLYYTVRDAAGSHNRVVRVRAVGDVAATTGDVLQQTVLLELDPLSDRTIHNGGALAFRDGRLLVTVGDNGDRTQAQQLTNRFGKVLRIERDGTIPADNPFLDRTTGAVRAVYAVGLRNPFALAVSRDARRTFVNDVGENTTEEVDKLVAGADYGWPVTEGPTTDPRFRGPRYSYPHTGPGVSGCAITGGAFYDPPRPVYRSGYLGDYFFADFCGGWIKRLEPSGTVQPFLDATAGQPIDIEVGPDGKLYYLSRAAQSLVRVDPAA